MSYATTDNNLEVHSRVISAFFDTAGAAKKAVDDLVAAGIPREHITQTSGDTAGELVATTPTTHDDRGFWESLKDLFLPEEDRVAYTEGLRRGGHLVSVRSDEANYTRVLDILDNDGAVDMDEREGQWRSEGWTGTPVVSQAAATSSFQATSAATLTSEPSALASRDAYKSDTVARTAATGRTAATADIDALASGRDEVIPVYEERLSVGKRDVSHGRVRLRSYVVETPVSEQISLHSETVTVDRKPVDRAINASDALFKERVIEAEERREEAVVAKDVRVKEEITLRKTAEDRQQTITDTVRSTKVDIDDGRGSASTRAATFSAQTDAALIVEHMDVISSDGQKIGEVDHLDGPDRIKLTKSASPDGKHHIVPFAWIDHIDRHVHLTKTLADIKAQQATVS